MKQAKQVEAELLAEVAAGKHQTAGAITLGQLLEEWFAWRESNGKLSASRARDVHAVLSGALGLAARSNYIPFNPAVLASPPPPNAPPRGYGGSDTWKGSGHAQPLQVPRRAA